MKFATALSTGKAPLYKTSSMWRYLVTPFPNERETEEDRNVVELKEGEGGKPQVHLVKEKVRVNEN